MRYLAALYFPRCQHIVSEFDQFQRDLCNDDGGGGGGGGGSSQHKSLKIYCSTYQTNQAIEEYEEESGDSVDSRGKPGWDKVDKLAAALLKLKFRRCIAIFWSMTESLLRIHQGH